MKKYKNIDGDSGVIGYEIFADGIRVVFEGKAGNVMYTYSRKLKPGQLGEMIRLAEAGNGLNSYINRNVSKLYDSRERVLHLVVFED